LLFSEKRLRKTGKVVDCGYLVVPCKFFMFGHLLSSFSFYSLQIFAGF
jgi:hypothetical protein